MSPSLRRPQRHRLDFSPISMKVCKKARLSTEQDLMAVDMDTSSILGACIMDNWTANSVQCHFMLTNPLVLKQGFLECCFEFIFSLIVIFDIRPFQTKPKLYY